MKNYKPLLVIRSAEDWETEDALQKLRKDMKDWHVLVVYGPVEEMTFEAYGAPDLDEVTIAELKNKLYIK